MRIASAFKFLQPAEQLSYLLRNIWTNTGAGPKITIRPFSGALKVPRPRTVRLSRLLHRTAAWICGRQRPLVAESAIASAFIRSPTYYSPFERDPCFCCWLALKDYATLITLKAIWMPSFHGSPWFFSHLWTVAMPILTFSPAKALPDSFNQNISLYLVPYHFLHSLFYL